MKYLMMLIISLGLVGCGGSSSGDSSSKGSDAVGKLAEFNISRPGEFLINYMLYLPGQDLRTLNYGSITIAQPTEEEIEKHREEATVITGNYYCFPDELDGTKHNICRYIDNTDSFFEEREWLYDEDSEGEAYVISEEYVEINSVNSRSTFSWSSSISRAIAARSLLTSTTYEGDESGEKSIVGEWTFKTYTFNDNKLISLKSATLDTCTETECTKINLTGLTYEGLTQNTTNGIANFWVGSQGENTAEVVMSPDHKELAIMICDFVEIKSITECSFIAGTRKE